MFFIAALGFCGFISVCALNDWNPQTIMMALLVTHSSTRRSDHVAWLIFLYIYGYWCCMFAASVLLVLFIIITSVFVGEARLFRPF